MSTTPPIKPKQDEAGAPDRAFPFLLSRLRNEFDEVMHRMGQAFEGWKSGYGMGWRWGLDVKDREDAFVVRAEAPGFTTDEIDVHVTDDALVIRAQKKEENKGKEGEEARQRECYQLIRLPPAVNKDKIEAQYSNGVLTVTLPKTDMAKGRKVEIKTV
jgi:HSP20 family protein